MYGVYIEYTRVIRECVDDVYVCVVSMRYMLGVYELCVECMLGVCGMYI